MTFPLAKSFTRNWFCLLALSAIAGAQLGPSNQPAVSPPPFSSITLFDPNDGREDEFGFSVALSGNVLVAGAPGTTFNAHSGQGVAYVFLNQQGNWIQAAELVASDGAASDGFGSAVAVAADGTVVVGAPNKNAQAGEAYVFEPPTGGWKAGGTVYSASTLLLGSNQPNRGFGFSVAIGTKSGTNFVLVGEPRITRSPDGPGSLYVFTGPGWNQIAKLHAYDATGVDQFGYAIAVSGTTAVIGAPWVEAAYIADGLSGTQQKISLPVPHDLGQAVAISGKAVVLGDLNATSAFVFTQASTGQWNQVALLMNSDRELVTNFGFSVAIDGPVILVGAPARANGTMVYAGAVYLFLEPVTGWQDASQPPFVYGSVGRNRLGTSLALNGKTAVAGAPALNGAIGTVVVLSPNP
jgi:FG-GAP repeat